MKTKPSFSPMTPGWLGGLAALLCLTTAQADWNLVMRKASGIGNTTDAEDLLSQPSSPSGGWTFDEFIESPNPATINVGGTGSFTPTNPLPNGNQTDDGYALQATANLVIPAGTWTIGFGSDDGGYIRIPGITFDSRFNSTGTFGADEIRYETGRGHNWTGGTFTVASDLTTTIEAIQYEGSGGDSWEIGLAPGEEGGFSLSTWAPLEDGLNGWTVQTAPINDVTPPALSELSPAETSTGAYPGGDLVATFDEEIALTGAGTLTVTDLTDGSGSFAIDLSALPTATGDVTVSGNQLIIRPATPLEFGTEYEVGIDGSSVEDVFTTPNAFAGTAPREWTFTTAVEDLVAPVVVSTDPADEATGVTPSGALVLTFDDPVVAVPSTSSVIFNEDFESGNGGFTTVNNSTGSDWEYGTPAGPDYGGGGLTAGNGGSTGAWGTDLDAGYTVSTDTSLISPVIDLTTVASAELSFAVAIDAAAGHTYEVNVIDDTSNTVIGNVVPVTDDGNPIVMSWENFGPVSLPAAASGQLVRLEWRFVGNGTDDYNGVFIDDVQLTGTGTGGSVILKNLTDGTETPILATDGSQVSIDGAVVTITPASALGGGKDYAVQIGTSAFKNYSEVNFAGIANDTTWNFSTSAEALFVTSDNDGTNGDSWTAGGNWDIGVQPSGALSATIQSGLTALANSTAVLPYAGGLTLESNATLQIGAGGNTQNRTESANALGTGPISMETGSKLQWQMKVSPTVPTLTLNGDASITTDSNESHTRNFNFAGGISGPGQLTFLGTNNQNHRFSVANPGWSGGLVTGVASSARTRFTAEVAGALGTGNVTIGASTDLQISAGDAIDDGADLILNGGGRDQSPDTKLILNGDETVNRLFIDGVQYPSGTYSESGATDFVGSAWLSGGGVLTVSSGPSDSVLPTVVSIDDNKPGGQIFDNGSATFTVTFSEPMVASTIDVSDFSNAGSASVSVDSVTPTGLETFEVEVTASSTGTLQLQINSGAVLEDFAFNGLDTASPILDDTVIDVIPFVPNSASLTTVFQATLASEQNENADGEGGPYHVSVNETNSGYAGLAPDQPNSGDPDTPFQRPFTDPVLGWSFVAGGSNGVLTVAQESGGLISYTTTDTTFDSFGQNQRRLWTTNDPGADLLNPTSSPNHTGPGYRGFGQIAASIDIAGLASGTVNVFYGGFSSTPSVRVVLKDSSGLHPDVVVEDAHLNGDNSNRGEYYVAEVDFVNDGNYDTIEYEWLANGSDDSGNGRFGGTVLTGVADTGGAPEIAVEQDSNDIPNGGGPVDFGTVAVGSDQDLVFAILNTGTAGLNLTGTPDLVTLSGDPEFTIQAQPATNPVPASTGSTSFTVRFSPTAAGARSATVSIASDDADENPFTFTVTGSGQSPYDLWANGGGTPEQDDNGDGISNLLAWLLGAADPGANALGLLPAGDENPNGDLVLSFSVLNAANRGGASMTLEWSNDLGIVDAWASNQALVPDVDGDVNGVNFVVVPNGDLNDVTATIPASEGPDGRLFGRVQASP